MYNLHEQKLVNVYPDLKAGVLNNCGLVDFTGQSKRRSAIHGFTLTRFLLVTPSKQQRLCSGKHYKQAEVARNKFL